MDPPNLDEITMVYNSINRHLYKDLNCIVLGYCGFSEIHIKSFIVLQKFLIDDIIGLVYSYLTVFDMYEPSVEIEEDVTDDSQFDIKVFASTFNFLRMASGMGSLAYSN